MVIPSKVTAIESNAFKGCSSLTSLTIPESVAEISDYIFGYGDAPTDFIIYGVKGTYAESFASDKGITFSNI